MTEPRKIKAGSDTTWTRALSDYPADAGWVLTYYLVSAKANIRIATVPSGADHEATIPAATSADWIPGRYRLAGYLDGPAAERLQIVDCVVDVEANLGNDAAQPIQSAAARALDLIDAALERKITLDVLASAIGDRSITRYTIDDLLRLRAFYARTVARENGVSRGGLRVRQVRFGRGL